MSVTASATAVLSSSSEALAVSRPVRSATIVWKFKQRLEPALADLGLVRRVRGVPGRALEDVAPDHARRDRAGVAEPDHRLGGHVARRPGAELLEHRALRDGRREVECRVRLRTDPGTAASISASRSS